MKQKELRVGMAIAGVLLSGICVGIFQKIALGTDPFTCFVTGIANLFGSAYSTYYVILTGILLLIIFFVHRAYIGLATIINLLGIGVMADWMRCFLDVLMPAPGMEIRLILLVVNVVLASFAASLYFTADLGVSAYDAVALAAANPYGWADFRYCRITTDILCVMVGFFYAADIGIGTVLTAFMMGPIIQWFNVNLSEPLLAACNT